MFAVHTCCRSSVYTFAIKLTKIHIPALNFLNKYNLIINHTLIANSNLEMEGLHAKTEVDLFFDRLVHKYQQHVDSLVCKYTKAKFYGDIRNNYIRWRCSKCKS